MSMSFNQMSFRKGRSPLILDFWGWWTMIISSDWVIFPTKAFFTILRVHHPLVIITAAPCVFIPSGSFMTRWLIFATGSVNSTGSVWPHFHGRYSHHVHLYRKGTSEKSCVEATVVSSKIQALGHHQGLPILVHRYLGMGWYCHWRSMHRKHPGRLVIDSVMIRSFWSLFLLIWVELLKTSFFS